MTTFHPVVLNCPQCGTLMGDFELMSYTVHHATSWSDGKSDTGMPDHSEIKICAVCRLPFWKAEATLPDDPDWNVADELGGALEIRDLVEPFDDGWQEFKINFYAKLIDEDFANDDDQERYLRTRLWWAINDLIRYKTGFWSSGKLRLLFRGMKFFRKQRKGQSERLKLFDSHAKLLVGNLDRLIFLTIKKGDIDLLYLAEMYREQRDFRKAKEILNKYEGAKNEVYHKLKLKTRMKRSRVVCLN